GINPATGKEVFVERDPKRKEMQRALIQFREPKNRALVEQALKIAGREDLIGYGPECLIRPAGNGRETPRNRNKQSKGRKK
ncbi:MAG: DUF3362 domain-containing protein, partial [Lachnospiraceae bacterium]|nr:DUF3362 domain-containing protein [Lachnospiraceae bacterium]